MKRTALARSGKPLARTSSREIRVCQNCGKSFPFALSQLNRYKGGGQFCSRSCSYAGQVQRTANKPVNDKYGRDSRKAHKVWKQAVRDRDEYICQRCGKYDPYIHAHHIASRARRPDLKYDVSNGVCLDGTCHQWVHHNPVEAEAAGWLKESRYELERLGERIENIGLGNRLALDEDEIVALHRGGMRAKAIARQLGCSDSPISRILKEHGCPPHPVGAPKRS